MRLFFHTIVSIIFCVVQFPMRRPKGEVGYAPTHQNSSSDGIVRPSEAAGLAAKEREWLADKVVRYWREFQQIDAEVIAVRTPRYLCYTPDFFKNPVYYQSEEVTVPEPLRS